MLKAAYSSSHKAERVSSVSTPIAEGTEVHEEEEFLSPLQKIQQQIQVQQQTSTTSKKKRSKSPGGRKSSSKLDSSAVGSVPGALLRGRGSTLFGSHRSTVSQEDPGDEDPDDEEQSQLPSNVP